VSFSVPKNQDGVRSAGVLTNPGIDADELIDAARTRTGLADLGPGTFRDGLDHLVDSLRGEARLGEIGAAITPDNLVGYLANRLQIVDWHARHPDAAAADVGPVVFMIGMGRTGTTILHDLLAQDPANRAPLTWEVDRPVPPPEPDTYDTDPRIAEVEAGLEVGHAARPELQAMHPTGARLAQECVRITGCEFASVIFGSQYHIPSYVHWVTDAADMSPAYRFHHAYLRVLGAHVRRDRWVLKSGAHLWALPELLAEYPDARFIQTHRDPVKVIASLSSLFTYLGSIFSDAVALPDVSVLWSDVILDALDRSVTAREDGSIPPDRVVDVQFDAFMADHFGTIRSIYDAWGAEYTPDAERRMRAFLDAHGREKHGVHRYSFSDTGLDEGEIRDRAKRYVDYFDVTPEP
jgi:hypothetical protein